MAPKAYRSKFGPPAGARDCEQGSPDLRPGPGWSQLKRTKRLNERTRISGSADQFRMRQLGGGRAVSVPFGLHPGARTLGYGGEHAQGSWSWPVTAQSMAPPVSELPDRRRPASAMPATVRRAHEGRPCRLLPGRARRGRAVMPPVPAGITPLTCCCAATTTGCPPRRSRRPAPPSSTRTADRSCRRLPVSLVTATGLPGGHGVGGAHRPRIAAFCWGALQPVPAGRHRRPAFAAVLVYLPVLHGVLGIEALTPAQLCTVAPVPVHRLGADEIRRLLVPRHQPDTNRSPLSPRPRPGTVTTLFHQRAPAHHAVRKSACGGTLAPMRKRRKRAILK